MHIVLPVDKLAAGQFHSDRTQLPNLACRRSKTVAALFPAVSGSGLSVSRCRQVTVDVAEVDLNATSRGNQLPKARKMPLPGNAPIDSPGAFGAPCERV